MTAKADTHDAVPVDLDRLRAWLCAEGVGSGSDEIAAPRLLKGGTQNILLEFGFGGQRYVLRRPPQHLRSNSNETMQREARVLRAIATTAVPHPRLIAACDDDAVLGAAFYIMESVDGFNAAQGLPGTHAASARIRHAMGLALVDAAAALAACDYRALDLEGFGKPEGFLERQVRRWTSQLEGYSKVPAWTGRQELAGVDRIARWLDDNRPETFQPGIIHGDFHIANVLFRRNGPEIAGIIDWELSTIGDPLLDLGWLIATWPEDGAIGTNPFNIQPWDGFPKCTGLSARYADVTGRDVSAIAWYVALACFKLGIILEGSHVRACAGKAPMDVGVRLHERAAALFARALREIERT